MRHIQTIMLSSIFLFFATSSSAEQTFEEKAEEIAGEVKVNLTQGLAELYGFFKKTEKKANNIMYQTRDGFDQIIYDAQKRYEDKNQSQLKTQDSNYCIYSVYHCQAQ